MKDEKKGRFVIYFNLAELDIVNYKLENGAPNRKSVKRGKINKILLLIFICYVA